MDNVYVTESQNSKGGKGMKKGTKILLIVLSVIFMLTAAIVPVVVFTTPKDPGYVSEETDNYLLRYRPGQDYYDIVLYTGTDENVVIPAEINGVRVRNILEGAFSTEETNKNIKSVTFEVIYEEGTGVIIGGIEKIGERAFEGCSSLTQIQIPSTVKSLGAEAFSNSGLERLEVLDADTLKLEVNALKGADKLTTVSITAGKVNKDNLTNYGSGSNIDNIEIGNSVSEVTPDAFNELSSMTTFSVYNIDTLNLDTMSDINNNITTVNILPNTPVLTAKFMGKIAMYCGKNVNTINIYPGITVIEEGTFTSTAFTQFKEYGGNIYIDDSAIIDIGAINTSYKYVINLHQNGEDDKKSNYTLNVSAKKSTNSTVTNSFFAMFDTEDIEKVKVLNFSGRKLILDENDNVGDKLVTTTYNNENNQQVVFDNITRFDDNSLSLFNYNKGGLQYLIFGTKVATFSNTAFGRIQSIPQTIASNVSEHKDDLLENVNVYMVLEPKADYYNETIYKNFNRVINDTNSDGTVNIYKKRFLSRKSFNGQEELGSRWISFNYIVDGVLQNDKTKVVEAEISTENNPITLAYVLGSIPEIVGYEIKNWNTSADLEGESVDLATVFVTHEIVDTYYAECTPVDVKYVINIEYKDSFNESNLIHIINKNLDGSEKKAPFGTTLNIEDEISSILTDKYGVIKGSDNELVCGYILDKENSPATHTIENVETQIIKVVFIRPTFTVTFSNGGYGNISETQAIVNYGSTITFPTVVRTDGYYVDYWKNTQGFIADVNSETTKLVLNKEDFLKYGDSELKIDFEAVFIGEEIEFVTFEYYFGYWDDSDKAYISTSKIADDEKVSYKNVTGDKFRVGDELDLHYNKKSITGYSPIKVEGYDKFTITKVDGVYNTTIRAFFSKVEYTIELDTNGGNELPSYDKKVIGDENPFTDLLDKNGEYVPLKDGYTFDYWVAGQEKVTNISEFNAEFIEKYAKDEKVKLTAVYKANSYTIKYDNVQNEYNGETSATYGEELTLIKPELKGQIFTGWTIKNYDSSKNANAKYYDGNEWKDWPSTNTLETTTNIKVKNLTTDTSVVTIEANFQKISYIVKIDLNGGKLGTANSVQDKNPSYGSSFTIDDEYIPVKDGFYFIGWKLDGTANGYEVNYDNDGIATFKNLQDTQDKEVTITAQYAQNDYVVKFNNNTSEVSFKYNENKNVSFNHTLTTDTGKEFDYWTFNGITLNKTISGLTEYSVAYFINEFGLDIDPNEVVYTGGNSLTVTKVNPHTIELIPVYKSTKYRITFENVIAGYNSGITDNTVDYDKTTGVITLPTKFGYEFAGWTLKDYDGVNLNKNAEYYDGSEWKDWDGIAFESDSYVFKNLTTTDTVTLQANWTATTYTLKFDTDVTINGLTANNGVYTLTYDKEYTININDRVGFEIDSVVKHADSTITSGALLNGNSWTGTNNTLNTLSFTVKNLNAYNSNVELNIKWKANLYNIKIERYNITENVTIAFDSEFTLDAPSTRNGWTFNGYIVTGYNSETALIKNGDHFVSYNGSSIQSAVLKGLTPDKNGEITIIEDWSANTDNKIIVNYYVSKLVNGIYNLDYTNVSSYDLRTSDEKLNVTTGTTFTISDLENYTKISNLENSFGSLTLQNTAVLGGEEFTISPESGNEYVVNLYYSRKVIKVLFTNSKDNNSDTNTKEYYFSSVATGQYNNGEEENLPLNIFEISGHKITGWKIEGYEAVYTNVNDIVNNTVDTDGEVTLESVWNELKYTLTFDTNVGTDIVTMSAPTFNNGTPFIANGKNYSATIPFIAEVTVSNPSRMGYTFEGWFIDADNDGQFDFDEQKVTSFKELIAGSKEEPYPTITLTADWQIINFVFKFGIEETQLTVKDTDIVNFETLVARAIPTGYEFKNLYFECGEIDKQIALQNYTAKELLVACYGSASFDIYNSQTTLEFYADYQAIENTIKFETGTTQTISNVILKVDSNVTIPSGNGLSKAGYTFSHWVIKDSSTEIVIKEYKVDNGGVNEVLSLYSTLGLTEKTEVTLTAVWTVNVYDVTFNLDGGEFNGTPSATNATYANNKLSGIPYTAIITIPEVKKTGYTFAGWYNGSTPVTVFEKLATGVDGDNEVTLTAKWSEKCYTISINENAYIKGYNKATYTLVNNFDATLVSSKLSYTFTEEFEAVATKTGYTFQGWSATGLNSQTAEYYNGTEWTAWNGSFVESTNLRRLTDGTSNIELTPYFVENQYVVVVNGNESTVYFTQDVSLSYTAPTGYTFKGWTVEGFNENTALFGGAKYDANNTFTQVTIDNEDYNVTTVSSLKQLIIGVETITAENKEANTVIVNPVNKNNQYKIVLDGNGVQITNNEITATFDKDSSVPKPSRIGYTFAGWVVKSGTLYTSATANGSTWNGTTPVGRDADNVVFKNLVTGATNNNTITLQATWIEHKYNVIVDLGDAKYGGNLSTVPTYNGKSFIRNDDGTYTATVSYSDVITVVNPTFVGYEFAGWDKTGTVGTNNYTFTMLSEGVEPKQDAEFPTVTITANTPSANTYEVTTQDSDSATVKFADGTTSVNTETGSYVIVYITPIRGYKLPTDITTVIKFASGSASVESYTTEVPAGTMAVKVSGYTETFTISADLDEISYSLDFDLNENGKFEDGVEVQTSYTFNEEIELPDPIRTGYTFDGWEVTNGLNDETALIKFVGEDEFDLWDGSLAELGSIFKSLTDNDGAEVTLQAHWTENLYTVIFNLDGGEFNGTPSATNATYANNKLSGVPYTAIITIPEVKKTGYTFAGWYNGSTPVTVFEKLATGDEGDNEVELTAKWTPNTIEITFISDVGDFDPVERSYTYDPSEQMILPTPNEIFGAYQGEIPTIWINEDGEEFELTDINEIIVNYSPELILIADGWTDAAYTINIENVPNNYSSIITGFLDLPVEITSNPTKNGYTFKGWTLSSDDESLISGAQYFNGTTYVDWDDPTEHVNAPEFMNLSNTVGTAVTLTAVWTENTYTVTFDVNGGTFNGAPTVTFDESNITPNKDSNQNIISYTITNVPYTATITIADPTRTGYTFAGWYNGSDEVEVFEGLASKETNNESITLTAKWDANEYKISINLNDADNEFKATLNDGTSYTATFDIDKEINTPTRPGYTFAGWIVSAGDIYGGAIAGSINSWDGEEVVGVGSTSVVFKNLSIGVTPNDDKTGYPVIELQAQWTMISYNIIIDENKDLNNDASGITPVLKGFLESFTQVAPILDGYTFAGWKITGSFDENTAEILNSDSNETQVVKYNGYWMTENTSLTFKYLASASGTVTLQAVWTVNKYSVIFDVNGGEFNGAPSATGATISDEYKLSNVKYTAEVTIADPTRTGYTFDGWFDGENKVTSPFSGLRTDNGAEVTLQAHWTENLYTVTFTVVNGGTFNGAPTVTLSDGSTFDENNITLSGNVYTITNVPYTATISINNPKLTGYEFKSWTVDVDGNAEIEAYYVRAGETNTDFAVESFVAEGAIEGKTITIYTEQVLIEDEEDNESYEEIENGFIPNKETLSFAIDNHWTTETEVSLTVNYYYHNSSTVGKTETKTLTSGNASTVTVEWYYGAKVEITANINATSYVVFVQNDSQESKTYEWSVEGDNTLTYTVYELFTITYCDNDETELKTVTVRHGAEYNYDSYANELSKTGYTVNGWQANNSKLVGTKLTTETIKESKTVYANWTENTYTLIIDKNFDLDNNHETDTTNVETLTNVLYTATITVPVLTKVGYTFNGWYNGSTPVTVFEKLATGVEGDNEVTITAKWTENTYTLIVDKNFDLDNNSTTDTTNVETLTKNYTDVFTIADPTKVGYTFNGWGAGTHDDENEVTTFTGLASKTTNNESITLTANWTVNSYTIVYNKNHNVAAGEMSNTTFNFKTSQVTVSTNTFINNGWSFKGWSLTSSVNNVETFTKVVGGDNAETFLSRYGFNPNTTTEFTLYAIWTENTYTVNIKLDGGTMVTPTVTLSDGSTFDSSNITLSGNVYTITNVPYTAVITITKAEKVGYTFKSWKGGSGVVNKIAEFNIAEFNKDNSTSWSGFAENQEVENINSNVKFIKLNPNNGTTVEIKAIYNEHKYIFNGEEKNFSEIIELELPSNREGWTFTGWTLSNLTSGVAKVNGNIINATSYISSAEKLTLQYLNVGTKDATYPVVTVVENWTENTYTVTFDANEGTFDVDGSGVVEDDEMPYYTHNGNTVYFTMTGTSIATATVPYTAVITVPDPTRTGYTFAGWYNGSDEVIEFTGLASKETNNESITLTAKWTARTYRLTINFVYNAIDDHTGTITVNESSNYVIEGIFGNLVSVEIVVTGEYDYVLSLGSSLKDSYNVEPSENVNSFTYPWNVGAGDETITIYLNELHEVTFNANGGTGTVPDTIYATHGTELKLDDYHASLNRDGHTYQGWATSSTATSAESTATINANTTIFAVWTVNVYDVTFNLDGGEFNGTPSATNATYDNNELKLSGVPYTATITIPEVKKTGYTFDYWFIDANSNNKYDEGEEVTTFTGLASKTTNNESITLTAKWTVNSYTVYVDLNDAKFGGTFTTIPSYKVGDSEAVNFTLNNGKYVATVTYDAVITLNAPNGIGYTFNSWSLDKNTLTNLTIDGNKTTATGLLNGTKTGTDVSVTITANWDENLYKLTLNANGGTFDVDGSGVVEDDEKPYYTHNGNTVYFTMTGTSIAIATVPYTAVITVSDSTPTRTGYTFAGWNNGSTPVTVFEKLSLGTKNEPHPEVEITAVWEENTYTVTFDVNSGTFNGAPTVTLSDGSTFDESNITPNKDSNQNIISYTITNVPYTATITINNPILTGYSFTGWTVNVDGNRDTNDYYHTSNSFAVSEFVEEGATTTTPIDCYVKTLEYKEDGDDFGFVPSLVEFKVIYRSSNSQVHPNLSVIATGKNTTVEETLSNGYTYTIYARYGDEVSISVYLVDNGYTYILSRSDITGNLNLNEYTWDTTVDGLSQLIYDVNQVFTVTYYDNDGSLIYTATYHPFDCPNVINGASYDVDSFANTLTKSGYTANGWQTTNTKLVGTRITNNITMNGNKVVYANWTVNKYDVTFNLDGGEFNGTPSATNATYANNKLSGVPYTAIITIPEVKKTGYTFAGWYNGSTSVTVFEKLSLGTKNEPHPEVELTAKWEENTYTVTFDPSGGTFKSAPTVTLVEGTFGSSNIKYEDGVYKIINVPYTATITPPTVEKTGLEFNGWYEGLDKIEEFTKLTCVNKDEIYLVASWNVFNIELDVRYGAHYDSDNDEDLKHFEGGSIIVTQGEEISPIDYKYTIYTNTSVSLKAVADEGYTFVGWYELDFGTVNIELKDLDELYSTNNEIELSLSADTQLYALFIADVYDINVSIRVRYPQDSRTGAFTHPSTLTLYNGNTVPLNNWIDNGNNVVTGFDIVGNYWSIPSTIDNTNWIIPVARTGNLTQVLPKLADGYSYVGYSNKDKDYNDQNTLYEDNGITKGEYYTNSNVTGNDTVYYYVQANNYDLDVNYGEDVSFSDETGNLFNFGKGVWVKDGIAQNSNINSVIGLITNVKYGFDEIVGDAYLGGCEATSLYIEDIVYNKDTGIYQREPEQLQKFTGFIDWDLVPIYIIAKDANGKLIAEGANMGGWTFTRYVTNINDLAKYFESGLIAYMEVVLVSTDADTLVDCTYELETSFNISSKDVIFGGIDHLISGLDPLDYVIPPYPVILVKESLITIGTGSSLEYTYSIRTKISADFTGTFIQVNDGGYLYIHNYVKGEATSYTNVASALINGAAGSEIIVDSGIYENLSSKYIINSQGCLEIWMAEFTSNYAESVINSQGDLYIESSEFNKNNADNVINAQGSFKMESTTFTDNNTDTDVVVGTIPEE